MLLVNDSPCFFINIKEEFIIRCLVTLHQIRLDVEKKLHYPRRGKIGFDHTFDLIEFVKTKS